MTLLPEVLKLGATSATGVYPNAFGLIASTRDIVFGLAVIFFLMYEPRASPASGSGSRELLDPVAVLLLSHPFTFRPLPLGRRAP